MWFEIQSKSFPKKLIWNQSKSLKKWFKIPILIVAIENRQFTGGTPISYPDEIAKVFFHCLHFWDKMVEIFARTYLTTLEGCCYQAISFSIAEFLKKDVVPIRKYYIMVKLFEKLPKLVEKKKPISNTFWNSRQGVVLFTFLSISWAIKTTFTVSYWLDISEQNMKQWQFLVIFNIWRWKRHPF